MLTLQSFEIDGTGDFWFYRLFNISESHVLKLILKYQLKLFYKQRETWKQQN